MRASSLQVESKVPKRSKDFIDRVTADLGSALTYRQVKDNLYPLDRKGILEKSSIVLTTSGKKASVLYANEPNDGTADFSYTQNTSNGSIINENGNIEVLPANTPRITWINGKPEILVQEGQTNLFAMSNPTSADGTSSNVTYEAFSWDIGFTNCIKFGDNSVSRLHYGGSVTAGQDYTIGAFIQMDDLSEPILGTDLAYNIGGSTNLVYNKIQIPNTNIWYCYGSRTTSNTTTNNGIVKLTGYSTKGFRATGLILVDGIVSLRPESYIRTTGAIATRNDDFIRKQTASSQIGQERGTVYLEANIQNIQSDANASSRGLFSFDDGSGSADNMIECVWTLSSGATRVNRVELSSRKGGINQASIISSFKFQPGDEGIYKFCLVYDFPNGIQKLFINGVNNGTNNIVHTGFGGILNNITVGTVRNNSQFAIDNSIIKWVNMKDKVLTEQEVIRL